MVPQKCNRRPCYVLMGKSWPTRPTWSESNTNCDSPRRSMQQAEIRVYPFKLPEQAPLDRIPRVQDCVDITLS